MTLDIIRHSAFASDHVRDRHVEILLPDGYEEGVASYPVLYMHDGQNLFHAEDAFAGVTWGVSEILSKLRLEENIGEVIVVGIWNTPERIPEYMPERLMEEWADPRALKRFSKTYGGRPKSDAYLRFLVEELKPFVDTTYRTLDDAPHTWVMGSSMGGLVSLYALCEYPDVFSAAACLSTSWTIAGRVLLRYLERSLPSHRTHRFYFDYGSEAQIARYEAMQNAVNRLLARSGYSRDVNWMTRRFPGAAHDEAAWRSRLDVPLRFLLGPKP